MEHEIQRRQEYRKKTVARYQKQVEQTQVFLNLSTNDLGQSSKRMIDAMNASNEMQQRVNYIQ